MWAPPVNNSGHSTLTTAEPKWVPYMWSNSPPSDVPPEGASANSMLKNSKPTSLSVSHNSDDTCQPVVRRIASAPLQYHEVIPKGHSHSSKSFNKKRPKTDVPKNQNPPRIKASISTISWREELTHFKSSHPQSPPKNKPVSKAKIFKSEENNLLKNADDKKISKNGASKALSSVDFNGREEKQTSASSLDAILTSLKTIGTNGVPNSKPAELPPQSKTELEMQDKGGDSFSHFMESISAARKMENVTRSHIDVTDQSGKDNALQAKKRCSSENNLTSAQKNEKLKTSGPRSSSLSGKSRYQSLTHLGRGMSPKKTEKKPVTEVQETVKEKKKSYDPEKAREYIKQQRCERLSSIREEKERKKASEEAKKQKLSELDHKRHLLLQANIKKKPLQAVEERIVPQPKTEDLKAPASVLVPKSSSVPSNILLRRPATASTSESGLYVFPGPPHSVVPSRDAIHPVDNNPVPRASSDSSAIIIKDIHDMKATIEILSNTIKNALHSSKSEHSSREKKRAPTVVQLQESSELKIGEKVEEIVKIQAKPLSPGKPSLKDSFDAAEVHHLSNNLRKMKENFRCVLAQNLIVRPKPKSETKLKSVESQLKSDPTLAEKERLQQWLQKIPTGGLSGSSSEIDKAGGSGYHKRPKRRRTRSNILHNWHQPKHSLFRRHGTLDDSDQENLSGGPLHHARVQSPPKSESDTVNVPEWMKPLTQEPYPVNFMSVVKRKMAAKKTEKEAPTSNFTTNPSQSVPVTSSNLCSSSHLNPLHVPSTSQDPTIDSHNQLIHKSFSAKHDLIPPTDGLFSIQSSHLYSLFPEKPNRVEKSQQTTPKDSVAISPTDDFLDDSDSKPLTADNSSWSGQIINTSVPPLPRLNSTTTEASSKAASPELLSSGTSTRVSQVLVKPSFIEYEKEPLYESDFEEAPAETRKSGEDTDAPSISSTIPENCPDTDSIRLVTPNVDLFSKKAEPSDWSSRRDCGDGEHASQESSNLTGKESFEVGRLFNPEAITLQFQAELNRLDAFNESLFHVMEVEKVRAVTLAREQAHLSTKLRTTSEQPPPSISDKAVSAQESLPLSSADMSSINYTRGSGTPSSGEISTINYARGSGYSATPPLNVPQVDVAAEKTDSSGSTIKTDVGDTIKTDLVENEVSTDTPSSPVGTSQPSSIPEKSPSPKSSDATISEDVKSLKSPQEAVRSQVAKEKGPLRRMKLRQASDKVSSETLSKGSKAVSIEDGSSEPSIVHGPDPARTGDAGAVSKSHMERSDRRSAVPSNNEDAFKFTLQMLEQLMYEEELRVQHKRTLLKLRERVLCDMAKAECASLDLDKKKLRDIGGQEEQISALRKKQRGVLMKFQQQREEINLMQRTDELVWKERRLMYLRQLHLFRMQMWTRSHKNRRDEDGASIPKSVVTSRGITSRRDHDIDNTPDFNALLASVSLSSPSVASDLSTPSVPLPINTSGDTESSCVDERPLQSIKDLELRSRNCRDADPLRQPVEQLNVWRRRLEEEERQLRDADKHWRHRSLHLKHSLRDRSTSPFQFSEISNFGRSSGNSKQRSRPISNGSVEEDSSVTENIPDQQDSIFSSVKEVLSAAAVSEPYTESFESTESEAKTTDSQNGSAEVPTQSNGSKEASARKDVSSTSDCDIDVKTKQPLLHEKSKGHPSVTIKVPLSPRLQRVQRRRYSSGSDDSIVFSQTETGSEQSDIEGRITALTEQLEQRKAEAERLRREAKRTRSERLLAKEQSLQKQLQAYDVYISQARQNLDAELKQTSVPIVRPQIKQPRVASAGKAKCSNTTQQAEHDVSIQDSVAESSASQDSSLDAAALSPSKQNGAEVEFVLPEHSGPKDVISDAMSSVASGDISEVSSENGSTISNENASLVPNTGGKNEVAVKKTVVDVGSDTLSNASSDVGSEIATDGLSEMETCAEIIEDAAKEDTADNYNQAEEFNEIPAAPSPVSSDNVPLEKADASESEDAEDFIEEANDANFIKIVMKEKDKKLEFSSEPATEESFQPLIEDQRTAFLVNKITDSILQQLLDDCVQTAVTPNKSCDVIKKEDQVQDSGSDQTGNKAKDVRSRVNKILADTIHSPSSRTEPRMQDLMVTTYDILSPEDSPCTSPHQGSPTRQMSDNAEDSDSRVHIQVKPFEGSVGKVTFKNYSSLSGPSSIFNDSSQDWLDEEYSGAAEKELLRLQEIQIEQRIQLLDQAIDQIPFFIREIPNKPPPPYTPPGQAPRVLATSVPCSPPLEEIRAVTKGQSEIVQAVTIATNMLYDAHCRNQDLKTVNPPESFLVEGYTVPEHVKLSEQDLQIHKNSARVYRRLLFELARQLVEEAYSYEQEEECPPWLQPENVFSKRKALAEAPQSRKELQQVVSKQVLALFGFGPKAEKENLTIRWSRKKRDHVDELLVRELQEEERQWTSYEYDEAVIKNNITESILEALLIDTTEVIKEIFQRRQRGRCVGLHH